MTLFNRHQSNGRKILSMFITAGFPSLEMTPELILALEAGGADMIEIGIPFSDPIADGPTIQRSSECALRNGTTLKNIFGLLDHLRDRTEIPLVLMGYYNPIIAFGVEKFFEQCSSLGIDGIIVPDLTLEEGESFRAGARGSDIAAILLASPTTPPERMALLDRATSGFLYYISLTGVTGSTIHGLGEAAQTIRRARGLVRHPILAGFGISTPADAVTIAGGCDGVIIGSALIKLLEDSPGSEVPRVTSFTQRFRTALDEH